MIESERIKAVLLEGDYVSQEDYDKAEAAAKSRRISPLDYLLSEKIITRQLLGQALAESLHIGYVDLETAQPSVELLNRIPERIGVACRLIVCREDENTVTVASDALPAEAVRQEIERIFPGKQLEMVYALTEDIDHTLLRYRQKLATRFSEIIKTSKRVAPEIIDQIIDDAALLRASDIHFEPQEKEVLIRFRVDGMLQEAGRLGTEYYDNILNRIKIQARLRTDEHTMPQDGAIRFTSQSTTADLRVSIAPTLDGEKIVIRLLGEYIRQFALTDLGLSDKAQADMIAASKKPFGMMLVTGPTGSGKSTTLYSILKLFNDMAVNITTIEDPVEYKIPGVNQMQVNPATRLTFSRGLRSIVRQDPNIILVGEIRDAETAEISVNAALTGHLLFSTFHANDAASSIPRLLEMGIEPFLLASTLNMIVAQRLVRRLCEGCRVSEEKPRTELEHSFPQAAPYLPEKITMYLAKGCDRCNHTGFRGRIAIFEVITMTQELQELILRHASAREIAALTRKQGTISLFEDGVEKVIAGLTTLPELLRVAEPPHS